MKLSLDAITMESQEPPAITVLIAEDYQLNREGIKFMLGTVNDIPVIGEAADGEECVKLTKELKPTIVLMDIGMPVLDGIEATQKIKEFAPETKIIIFTSHKEPERVMSALRAGADGYCLKDVRSQQLISAIRSVVMGAVWLDPGIAGIVLKSASAPQSSAPAPVSLTEDELIVLRLVVDGLTNQEIAKRIYKGLDSVKGHMRCILEKMAVTGRTQAAIKAVRDGLV